MTEEPLGWAIAHLRLTNYLIDHRETLQKQETNNRFDAVRSDIATSHYVARDVADPKARRWQICKLPVILVTGKYCTVCWAKETTNKFAHEYKRAARLPAVPLSSPRHEPPFLRHNPTRQSGALLPHMDYPRSAVRGLLLLWPVGVAPGAGQHSWGHLPFSVQRKWVNWESRSAMSRRWTGGWRTTGSSHSAASRFCRLDTAHCLFGVQHLRAVTAQAAATSRAATVVALKLQLHAPSPTLQLPTVAGTRKLLAQQSTPRSRSGQVLIDTWH